MDFMIKMIVMDMDGTLLNSKNHILTETKEALLQLQKQGIRLVLASGRSYTRLMPYAEELQMNRYGGYLVEINGTAIYDVQNAQREVLSQIDIPQAKELFQYFMKWNVEILGQLDDGMFCYMSEQLYEEKRQYRLKHHIKDEIPWTAGPYDFIFDNRNGYPNHIYIHDSEEINRTLNKVSIAYHEDVIAKVSEIAKRELQDRYWLGLTSPRWLEIMPLGVTKASGLQEVSRQTGIRLDEMMSFGDSENDVDMLKATGYSIVMGNALDGVKMYADELTDTNDRNGIEKALKKHFSF